METHSVILWSLSGALAGSVLACVPGLHVASTLAVLMAGFGGSLSGGTAVPFAAGLVVSYAVSGFIPLVYMSVPDEGLFAAINPVQALLREGRAIQGIRLGACGAVAGVVITAVIAYTIGPILAEKLIAVLGPHWHWIVWTVTAFLLMSEWPQRAGPGLGRLERFLSAWRLLVPGLMVFAASSILGVIVFFSQGGDAKAPFASIMPMVSGLFSLPWLVLAAITGRAIPPQEQSHCGKVRAGEIAAGTLSGWLGGIFACIVPGVTAGVGGFLAGHTCSINNRNGFVAAQGSARSVYLCGALMLMFLPGVNAARGGCAMMLMSVHEPFPQVELPMVLGALLTGAALSLALSGSLASLFAGVAGRVGTRSIAGLSLMIVVTANWYVTGWRGICVMVVAAMIGAACILYGARRMNCLGSILVPVGIALSGWGDSFL